MNTKIIKKNNTDEAAQIIKNGGIVAFPTETVYGLGANALEAKAVKKIFAAKGRPADNPLIVHIADKEQINILSKEITDNAKKLIDAFMPGPITVILKKSDIIPNEVSAGLDTVGIRFPGNETARKFIAASGVPIAAPSANISGKPSPTKAKHVMEDMMGRIEGIIDGDDCAVGVESTIVDASSERPSLLRPGGITVEKLREVCPDLQIDPHVLESVNEGEQPRCPGMKYKHYAPKAKVIVVEGECANVRKKINEIIERNNGKIIGVLTMYDSAYDGAIIIDGGNDNKTYANKLFGALREFDDLGANMIIAEFCDCDGYGLAVKNRLYKAAAYNIVNV